MPDPGTLAASLVIIALGTALVVRGAFVASLPAPRPPDRRWPDVATERRVARWYGALLILVGAAAWYVALGVAGLVPLPVSPVADPSRAGG